VGGVSLGDVAAEDPQQSWCERLFAEKAAGLILYGRALGLSHSEAEDVVQDTFVALLKLAEPPDAPEWYCLTSFRNRALNFRRGLWRRITRELEARHWFDEADEVPPAERAAMRCLETLPPEQREVIVLKIWQGHTLEEIGRLLDLSPNTVAGRYRYGIQKLRTCLVGDEFHERLGDRTNTEELEGPDTFGPASLGRLRAAE
jgi:RNA polymerase sigma-70 factor, ECF subfamily